MAQVQHHIDRRSRDGELASEIWREIFYLFLLIVTFAAGVFTRQASLGEIWPHDWNVIFIALGSICLGFGAGVLVYRRRQNLEAEALRKDYKDLQDRAYTLGKEMDLLIQRRKSDD